MRYSYKAIISIMGVIFMLNFFGCSEGLKYVKYVSKNPEINFTADYISGWTPVEQIGSLNSFVQIVFREPIIKDKGLLAMMVVTIIDSSKTKFKPNTIDGMANDLVKDRMLFDSTKILSRSKIIFLGTDALDINLSYKTIDKPDRIDAKLLPYKERIIIFKRGENFYKVRYANFAKDFDKYSGAFDHFVKSIKFK